MSFHFRRSIGTNIFENEGYGGFDCPFCFIATGFSVPVTISSQWIDSPCVNFCRTFDWTFWRWPTKDISKLWWDKFVPITFFVVFAMGLAVLAIVFASECHTWDLDAVFSFKTFATGFPVLCALMWVSPGCQMHSNPVAVEDTKYHIGFWFCNHTLPFSWVSFLYQSLRNALRTWFRTNGEDDSTHHGWSCLSSACLRVGFWCQHIFDLIFWSALILSNN